MTLKISSEKRNIIVIILKVRMAAKNPKA